MTFGQELQKARKAAGLSQETVAFDAEIDRSYLSDIERDLHSPTVERLLRICKAIGVKPSEVFQAFESE
ncbi:MAG: helix-turn-helix domain-containing protein [Planctomycetes bacterium]|nr:helix-turn-helix domain-containing protein [Planctomycetota bacterium]